MFTSCGSKMRPNYLIKFSPYSILPFLSTIGPLSSGEVVIVKDRTGEDMGSVVSMTEEEEVGIILRKALDADLVKCDELKAMGEKSVSIFQEIRKEKKLPIKLIDHHIRWDKKKLTFYIIAHQKFDWEEFESLLSQRIPIKVRIKEVNPRLYASLLKGIGKCGREICCVKFRENLPRVSLRTARLQNLFIPTERISGICGRLICCLAYEEEIYQEAFSRYPPFGSIVKTRYGKGEVVGIDIFHERVHIRLFAKQGGKPPEREVSVSLKEISGKDEDAKPGSTEK